MTTTITTPHIPQPLTLDTTTPIHPPTLHSATPYPHTLTTTLTAIRTAHGHTIPNHYTARDILTALNYANYHQATRPLHDYATRHPTHAQPINDHTTPYPRTDYKLDDTALYHYLITAKYQHRQWITEWITENRVTADNLRATIDQTIPTTILTTAHQHNTANWWHSQATRNNWKPTNYHHSDTLNAWTIEARKHNRLITLLIHDDPTQPPTLLERTHNTTSAYKLTNPDRILYYLTGTHGTPTGQPATLTP